MEEISFYGESLQSCIDKIVFGNDEITDRRLCHMLDLSRQALRLRPTSTFWKDAVNYIEDKITQRTDYKQFAKCVPVGGDKQLRELYDKKAILAMYEAHKKAKEQGE